MRCDEVVVLRDSSWVASAMETWPRSRRLALRGATPSPRLIRALFEEDVALQQTSWTDDRRPAGLFQVSEVSEPDGTGLLDLLVEPRLAAALHFQLVAFLRQAFAALPVRKLCLWACDDELAAATYLGRLARPAGRLVAHDRRRPGIHSDMLVSEIWKEDVDGYIPAAFDLAGDAG
jgi:hypothetical protein